MPGSTDKPISKELLDILACPLCKTEVKLVGNKKSGFGLKCIKCNRVYPVKDGIPVMLVDEAEIKP